MLDDLLELTGSLVHPGSEQSPPLRSATAFDPNNNSPFDDMPPRSRHSKSASVASSTGGSTAVASNGEMLPPASGTPSSSKASSPVARKPRTGSRSTHPIANAISPNVAGSTPVVLIPSKQHRNDPAVVSKPAEDITAEAAKFAVAVVLSTILEAALQTVSGTIGVGDLAAVSKRPESWLEIGALLGWKVVLLGVYWLFEFDAYDVASLTLLLSTPTTILLGLFYNISPVTLISTTLSSILSTSAPYYFLRPLSPSHTPSSAPRSSLRNRSILTDPYTTIATSLLASAIFAVLLEASFATFLPEYLVVHFKGLRTIEAAHLGPSGLPTLLLALLPAGFATQEYIFAPSTAKSLPSQPVEAFDSVTASFAAHVYHNAWGWYSVRQKELISRTTILTALVVAQTLLHVGGTLNGVDLDGALGYAGIWGAGAVVVGAVLDWVGGPSD